ncbi:MAG: alkaline phosphatase family protein [Gammaproteobacteria bacterium]|nr:alkaline phosphatase family protein [Gammaproteobacteria bacterium]
MYRIHSTASPPASFPVAATQCLRRAARRFGALLTWFWIVGPVLAATDGKFDSVVLISIDGLRADVVNVATTPYLAGLKRRAWWVSNARSVSPPLTVPAHASMLTGLQPREHRVLWNSPRAGAYGGESVFSVVRDAGLATAAFIAKPKLRFLAHPDRVDYVNRHAPNDTGIVALQTIVADVQREWPRRPYAFTFVHVAEPDLSGHRSGWMSLDYLVTVKRVDMALAELLAVFETTATNRKVALIVTADHGGEGFRHHSNRVPVREVPWLLLAPGMGCGEIKEAVRLHDTAPTALALLGLEFIGAISGTPIAPLRGTDGPPLSAVSRRQISDNCR